MKSEKSEVKTKIIDWFIITKIRILNFIKEHKYLSVGIGAFIFSCVVFLVVFAETDDYENQITVSNTSVTRSNIKENEDALNAKSFSTIDYNVSYLLTNTKDELQVNRTIVIIAELPEGVDAIWNESNESNTYELLSRNKLKITAYNKKTGIQNTEIVRLSINNIKAGVTINPTFTIYESTANIEQDNKKSIALAPSISVINDKTVNLMAKAVSGNLYKVNSFEGRYVPYGIIVGIDKNELNNGTLEGIYFDSSIELSLSAKQQVNGVLEDVEIINDKNLYGTYDKASNKYFVNTNIPHYISDFNYVDEKTVFDSGNVSLEYGTAEKKEKEEINVGTISLVGEKEITVTQGVPYANSIHARGILIESSNEEVCTTSTNEDRNCSIEVKNELGVTVSIENFTNTKGNYTILYTYNSTNGTITTQRKVIVASSSADEYKLIDGNKVIIYVGDDKYNEPGIIRNGEVIKPISTNIKIKDNGLLGGLFGDDWKKVDKINTSEPNEYQITYTLDTEEELTRTVVVENISKTTSPSISAKNMQLPVNVSSYTPEITIAGEPSECSSANGCSFKYDRTFDTTKSGIYNITYTIVKDDFIITLNGYIHIALGETKIIINDIKSNGKIYYSDDQMIGLGSYFVTVPSSRRNDYKQDIPVQFYIAGQKVSESTNLYFDPGVLNLTTSLNEYSYGTITELSDNDYLVYGDDNVILRYLMEYPYGDTDKQVSVNIPIQDIVTDNSLSGNPFEIMKYYPAEENQAEEFYLSGIDISKTSIKYVLCKMESNGNCVGVDTIEKTTIEEVVNSYNEGYVLRNIICDFQDIEPGTTIDFRIRLKTTALNAGKSVNIKTITSYKSTVDSNYQNEETITKTVNITAFKARSKVLIGDKEETLKEQDKTVDGANVSYSTIAIYPTVTMPAANVTTNVIGTTKIDNINISVELPNGVNFVYNDNYIKPKTISGNKIFYEIKGQELNEWIEPIYLNVSYNIDIPVGTLEFKVVTQATIGEMIDSSSYELRTTTRRVIYQNSAKIAVGQYTDYLSVSKDVPFNIISKVYNNILETVNNLSLVTILPSNDEENTKFSGIYTLSNIPEGAMCSTEQYGLISNPKNYIGEGTITFNDCDEYSEDGYLGVTAIKMNIPSLDSGDVFERKIEIIPSENNTGDLYKVESLLISNEIVESNPLTIEVISKKITGKIWEDFDHNGLYDSTEEAIEGVTLTLIDLETGEEIDETTSNQNGVYSFIDLSEGTYHIIAEYNTAKYGSPVLRTDVFDRSKISSFESLVTEIPRDCEIDYLDCDNCEDEECDICALDCTECEDEYCEQICELLENSECQETIEKVSVAKTKDVIIIDSNTKAINNINLGLTLNKEYSVKLTKYITKAITTNAVGFATTNDFGKSKLAKLDIKDISKTNIKVIYTIELENVGYYPGYIYRIKDYIPDGMTFNPKYEENQGWVLSEEGYIENNSLEKDLVYAGDKKYLTVAFDITRKEAGSFINYAAVEDEDLHILVISNEVGAQYE